MFDDLFELHPETAIDYLSEKDRADRDKVVQAFYDMLRTMSDIERYSIFQSFYDRVPVPLFYQDLARLLKAGYFSHILTTSIDTLLDQALSGTSLGPNSAYQAPYQIITFDPDTKYDTSPSLTLGDTVTIIKLHGDLAQSAVLMPEEIENALNLNRNFIRPQFKGNMVIVGYEFESKPVNDWLAKISEGELWWVAPNRPDQQQIDPIEQRVWVHHINGPSAEPDAFFGDFFGELALRLLRLPFQQSMAKPFEAYWSFEVLDSISALNEDQLEEQYLSDQIRRCQAELHSLARTVALGHKDPQIEAQIDYQRDQLIKLEDQLRNLSSSKRRIPQLVDQISSALERAEIDPDTLSFLQTQVNTLKYEYSKDEANQHIVSASIGAMVSLAERLGTRAVDPQVVSTLASFAPSTLVVQHAEEGV